MNALVKLGSDWCRGVAGVWDRFWFTPSQPHTLALIRICGGAMLLYTHVVWAINLDAFLGPQAWLDAPTAALISQNPEGHNYAWSYLYWIESPAMLWVAHIAALVVFALLTIGFYTRVMAVLAWAISVAYCNRLAGTLFGLDQINVFIATYLMVGDSGGVWSVDRWLARRKHWRDASGTQGTETQPRIDTNIAVRLLQLHMCVIYLFGGIEKMRGDTWWDGSALWLAFASLEYQSLDMTWTVRYRWLLALLTHITVFWETFYCVLVWPKLTRPIFLALAVAVHAGIALCLGMKTFGIAMIIGNAAFVYPETVAALASWFSGLFTARSQNAVGSPIVQRESLAVAATR
jgi:hypothetical protein